MNTGHAIVDAIGAMTFEPFLQVPRTWLQHLRFASGKPDLVACLILADIVSWYRPRYLYDETTGKVIGMEKRFSADMLQRPAQEFANMFGFTKRQALEALHRLRKIYHCIRCEFRTLDTAMGRIANVLFSEPIPTRLQELSNVGPQAATTLPTRRGSKRTQQQHGNNIPNITPLSNGGGPTLECSTPPITMYDPPHSNVAPPTLQRATFPNNTSEDLTKNLLRETPTVSLRETAHATLQVGPDEIQAVLQLIHAIPLKDRTYANVFHAAVVRALRTQFPSWPLHKEYPTTYSNGDPGRIDIYLDTQPSIAIELDAGNIRQKSVHKLRQLDCVRIMGLRTIASLPRYDDALACYTVGAVLANGTQIVKPVVGAESLRRKKKYQTLSTAYTPAFLTFWEAYPADRRVGKPECFSVWQQEELDARGPEIIEKIDRLKLTTWKEEDPTRRRYIKTSLPWLNSKRYEDDLIPLPDVPVPRDIIAELYAEQEEKRLGHARDVTPRYRLDETCPRLQGDA